MAVNKDMYNELCTLRQTLKEQGKKENGRAPLVCTDEALYEIASMRPKKLSDFEGISGVGKTFIDNYGREFLDVVLKYEKVPTENEINISASTAKILKELEKKLVSINRRNRLLYMPKLSNKYAFDLFGCGNIADVIFKGKSVTVCDTSQNIEEGELVKYKRLVQLLREVNKDLRDKGQNDLYIGYPFVTGRFSGEDFNVRAPLALFPVTAQRTADKIILEADESRDVIYNNTLLLAYFKFNNITKPLPSDIAEEYSEENFIDTLLAFYADNDIKIQSENRELCKFCEYMADEFPKYRPGELNLEMCMVLGKFPICSGSIQKDFDEILKNNKINSLLENLLADAENIDIYSETEENTENDESEISERELIYINDLNSSQERVITAVDKVDELVVQGPPGTGKSQTIASLIAKLAGEGKSVLMVSEKKTALDVVYSRLGHLSKYALLIDDAGNKDGFYKQLSEMMLSGNSTDGEKLNLDSVSDEIDSFVRKLENIEKKLYTKGELDTEPYILYRNSEKIDIADEAQRKKVQTITFVRTKDLEGFKYNQLDRVHKKFTDADTVDRLEGYYGIKERSPWIESVNDGISEYDIVMLEGKLREISAVISEWKSKNALVRFFTKGKVKNAVKTVSDSFKASGNELLKLFVDNIDTVASGIGEYVPYQQLKSAYEELTEEERIYFKSMLDIKARGVGELDDINDELFNVILYERIGKLEAQNRTLFNDIDNFENIIKAISESTAKKQQLTKQKLEVLLSGSLYNITASKRHGEIQRVLESKRKWSVNKFIKKFDFELFKGIRIWLLTPEVVSEIIPLQTGIFDLVVFDEASQMYVEKGIPSILRAKKVVIAGDHKQLRPSSLGAGRIEADTDELPEDTEISAALEEESLLDLARFKYDDVLLNFHYRSKYEELIAFSNYAFYKGRLYVSPNSAPPEVSPIEVHKMDNAVWTNRTNMAEAKYIVDMLKRFFAERKENETVGIITFNISQRDLIEDLIDEECAKNPEFASSVTAEMNRRKDGEDIGLFVKNIESVQGDERDVIIFSVGYAKNESGKLVRNFGWLNQQGGENRLNVAISRAKKKVHIVTSFEPSELAVDDMKNDGPRILKKYLEYAFALSRGDREGAKLILASFGDTVGAKADVSCDEFENHVYNELVLKGLEVEKNIGIGGYTIDLAVKKNGKFVLGIEFDSGLYENSKSTRERDYHRQKYLELRGWRIYRLWSSNWWKNPDGEIEKICTLAELFA